MLADKSERIFKEQGTLEWQIDLPVKGKFSVGTATSVEFPADVRVTGVEGL